MIRAILIGFVMLAMLFANIPTQAAEGVEVPVKLTVTPEDIDLDDKIIIEAVTEKMGDEFEVITSNFKYPMSTTIEDGHYVSRVSFNAYFIGEKTFDYYIYMRGDGK